MIIPVMVQTLFLLFKNFSVSLNPKQHKQLEKFLFSFSFSHLNDG